MPRRSTHRSTPIAALLASLAVAAAFGAAAASAAEHTVVIEAMRFQPGTLRVHAGDRIVWTNRDLFPHTVVAAGGQFRSEPIAPGQSWRVTLRRTGVLAYGCSLHPTMQAEVRVD